MEPPPVDQTALRESNPVIKAKQLGIATDDPIAAATANAFVETRGFSADILSSDEGMKSFINVFDPNEGQVAKLSQRGYDLSALQFNSLDQLNEASNRLEVTEKGLADGSLKGDSALRILDTVGNEGNPDDADVDFSDPQAVFILDLKVQFPQFANLIDENKENAQQIVDLVTMVGPERAGRLFDNPQSLAIFLDPANQLMGQELDLGYIDLLATDPAYFKSIIPILQTNPQLPSQLFAELRNLNLSYSELTKVLADIQVGPQATPPGNPPSQVAQLTLQDEAGMLGLLDDRSFSGGVLDPALFAASEQVLASVFFTETADAYTALSDLDHSSDSVAGESPGVDDGKELILGGKNISFSTGSYSLQSADPVDFLIAAEEKLTLMGDLVFNPSSTDSDLILLSAGLVDLTQANSITFVGDELGIGSFDSLEIKQVDLYAENQISLRSLDNVVINNSKMETSGKGADFVHLLAANELQVNNLRFSESVKRIAMEAMTINLSNVNFPSASTVDLNSLYGGIDGKYPHFNSIQHGRVNFIEQIRYGNHLIMDRAAFDKHGGNITIGKIR